MIKNFQEAESFIFEKLFTSKKETNFSREERLEEFKRILQKFGNPQNKLRVIQVVGTSGKGSTAYLLSVLLRAHGFKVGLSLSPHIEDLRERLQINNHYLSKRKYVQYLNEVLKFFPRADLKISSFENFNYFQILSLLAWWSFYREKVDYVVYEAGKGGRDDLSNVVSTKKMVIITRIGKDHTKTLGSTLKSITKNKSEIVGKNDTVIAYRGNALLRKIFEQETQKKDAQIYYVQENREYANIHLSNKKTLFDFLLKNAEKNIFFNLPRLELGLVGLHQAENASLALTAVKIFSRRDNFPLHEKRIRNVLMHAYLPARLEIRQWKNKVLILDGAHNKQKIQALLATLKILFPHQKYAFLLPVSYGSTQHEKVFLRLIFPVANKVIFTRPSFFSQKIVFSSRSQHIKYIPHPQNALTEFLCQDEKIFVITGSFYFLAEMYKFLPKRKSI